MTQTISLQEQVNQNANVLKTVLNTFVAANPRNHVGAPQWLALHLRVVGNSAVLIEHENTVLERDGRPMTIPEFIENRIFETAASACEHDNSPVPREHAAVLVPHLAVRDGEVVVVDRARNVRERFGRPMTPLELLNELKAKGVIRYPL